MASEDRRFYQHGGVDVRGLARALLYLGRHGGGSTITQQVVKNTLLTHSRTLTRKGAELYLALVLERQASKATILERYLNSVYWGHGIVGVAGAAAAYFGKAPSQLDLNEAALLAGMLPGPERRTPFHSPAAADRGEVGPWPLMGTWMSRCLCCLACAASHQACARFPSPYACAARRQVLRSMAEMGVISRYEARRIADLGLPTSLMKRPFPSAPSPSPYPRSGETPQCEVV